MWARRDSAVRSLPAAPCRWRARDRAGSCGARHEIRVLPVARDSDAIELDIDGHPVRITSPGKVLFSERNETKLDLVNYYLEVSDSVMRTMGGRPVLMERYPHGAEGKSFFQKRVPENAPDWLTTEIISTPNGTTSNA